MSKLTRAEALKQIKSLKDYIRNMPSEKITERVKTFEDACAINPPSKNASILLDYNGIDKDMISAQASLKLMIITKALNEGWEPNWKNGSEYKYYPCFKASSSGFSLSRTDYVTWYATTICGSRLYFKTRELAEYAGKQFESIYNDLLTL